MCLSHSGRYDLRRLKEAMREGRIELELFGNLAFEHLYLRAE